MYALKSFRIDQRIWTLSKSILTDYYYAFYGSELLIEESSS